MYRLSWAEGRLDPLQQCYFPIEVFLFVLFQRICRTEYSTVILQAVPPVLIVSVSTSICVEPI